MAGEDSKRQVCMAGAALFLVVLSGWRRVHFGL